MSLGLMVIYAEPGVKLTTTFFLVCLHIDSGGSPHLCPANKSEDFSKSLLSVEDPGIGPPCQAL